MKNRDVGSIFRDAIVPLTCVATIEKNAVCNVNLSLSFVFHNAIF